ncbi:MAG: hypothetical protein SWH78_15685 [Thermodesulfobacteriota bacterium]|nr:hypothetical protein [Thermodesulfobacteriota bacterium]
MEVVKRIGLVVGMLGLLVVVTSFCGCATWPPKTTGAETPEVEGIEGPQAPEPVYYDFDDVLVPLELKVDKGKSFVYHAPDFKAGILSLSGRVEIDSVIRFFENNMAKDNWRLLSAFKSPRTIMFFNKPNRSCIINITERQFRTEVEIWVAPTAEQEEVPELK